MLITLTPVTDWYARQLAGGFDDPTGDVLVVLGGLDGGILGQGSYIRAKYAIRAYHEGGFRQVVVSGGGQPVAVTTVISEVLQAGGVPKEAIIVEPDASSTRENALGTKLVLDQLSGRTVLLSSD